MIDSDPFSESDFCRLGTSTFCFLDFPSVLAYPANRWQLCVRQCIQLAQPHVLSKQVYPVSLAEHRPCTHNHCRVLL